MQDVEIIKFIYIRYIGNINDEYIYKYGSSRPFEKDYVKRLEKYRGSRIISIGKTCKYSPEEIKFLFKEDLKKLKLDRVHKKYGKNLFTDSDKYSLDNLEACLRELINKNSEQIKEDPSLSRLDDVINLRKLEFQFKMTDGYRLEIQRDIIAMNIKLKEAEINLKEAETKLFIAQSKCLGTASINNKKK